jgi:hypothetical protein
VHAVKRFEGVNVVSASDATLKIELDRVRGHCRTRRSRCRCQGPKGRAVSSRIDLAVMNLSATARRGKGLWDGLRSFLCPYYTFRRLMILRPPCPPRWQAHLRGAF